MIENVVANLRALPSSVQLKTLSIVLILPKLPRDFCVSDYNLFGDRHSPRVPWPTRRSTYTLSQSDLFSIPSLANLDSLTLDVSQKSFLSHVGGRETAERFEKNGTRVLFN